MEANRFIVDKTIPPEFVRLHEKCSLMMKLYSPKDNGRIFDSQIGQEVTKITSFSICWLCWILL